MNNPWYPHYTGDYLRDTAHLSLAEHGAYRLALDFYYSTACPLPADLRGLYRICRAVNKADRQAVDSVLSQFFDLQADGYHNKRADAEIAKNEEKRKRLSLGAQKTNERRWPNPSPSDSLSESPSDNDSDPLLVVDVDKTLPLILPKGISSEDWKDFKEMRVKIGSPVTRRAERLAVNKLEKLASQGYDAKAVLEQSILNCWKGFFPIDEAPRKGGKPNGKDINSAVETTMRGYAANAGLVS